MCVLRLVSVILAEISAHHLQLKCMGGHFCSVPSLHREYYRLIHTNYQEMENSPYFDITIHAFLYSIEDSLK